MAAWLHPRHEPEDGAAGNNVESAPLMSEGSPPARRSIRRRAVLVVAGICAALLLAAVLSILVARSRSTTATISGDARFAQLSEHSHDDDDKGNGDDHDDDDDRDSEIKSHAKSTVTTTTNKEEHIFELIADDVVETVTTTSTTATSTHTTSTRTFSTRTTSRRRTTTFRRTITHTTTLMRHWWAWPGLDYTSNAMYDGPTQSLGSIAAAKAQAVSLGYSGFAWENGQARFKKTPTPLLKSDLDYVGGGTTFFTFSPIQHWNWKDFPGCTLSMPDAEVISFMGDSQAQKHAEDHGYAGYEVISGKAHMKAARDLPLRPEELTNLTLSAGPNAYAHTVWLPIMRREIRGDAADFYDHHLFGNKLCSAAGQSCMQSQCCANPFEWCFEKDAGYSACSQSCHTGAGWTCKVHGTQRVPGSELLCFTVVDIPQLSAISAQLATTDSLAGCDDYLIFAPQSRQLKLGVWTHKLDDFSMARSGPQRGRPDVKTMINAWNAMMSHFVYRTHAWTIKIDPDAVFFPGTAKVYLMSHATNFENFAYGKGLYLRTCMDGVGGRMSEGVQVVSRTALTVLNFHIAECGSPMYTELSEAEWLQGCLEKLGIEGYKLQKFAVDTTCHADASVAMQIPNSCSHRNAVFYKASPMQHDACVRAAGVPR